MSTSGIAPSTAPPVARLIDAFHRLPGVGPKGAQRLTYFLIRMPRKEAEELAEAILSVKDRIVLCDTCANIGEKAECAVCADLTRDRTRICVVEEPLDVVAIERTHVFRGMYHVLHGVISPVNGVGPEDLKVRELLETAQGRRCAGGDPGDQPQSRGGRRRRCTCNA